VPIREISCPLKKSWKLRWRSARHAACQRDPGPEAASAPLGAALSWIGILDSDTIVSLDDSIPSHDYYNLHGARVSRQGSFPADGARLVPFLDTKQHGITVFPPLSPLRARAQFLAFQTGRIALQLHLRLRFARRFP
jgi:hypothetical protein